MNPNRGESSQNFELPSLPASAEQVEQEQGQEAPATPAEAVGKQAPPVTLPPVPAIPVSDQPVLPVLPQDTATPIPAVDPHLPAQDSDRIEALWVDKAKAIIARTHDDPHLQKNEMSKVKAEYIKKRFNKTIKTDNAATV